MHPMPQTIGPDGEPSAVPASLEAVPSPLPLPLHRSARAADEVPLSAVRDASLLPVWMDRDLGWIEFNRRVLAEALDERTPLLERVKFLAIFSANLDEFFMKRIAVLREDLTPERVRLL